MSYEEALTHVPKEIKRKYRGINEFRRQAAECQDALNTLAETLQGIAPDIVIIISDDQDEWFFENNMPCFSVYWGTTAPLRPRQIGNRGDAEIREMIIAGYGSESREISVAHDFGRFLVERLTAAEFDVSQFTYVEEEHGGSVSRRYPTRNGELELVKTTPRRSQGLPHGYSFVISRLLRGCGATVLPVFQNTCYPPNTPSPRRCFNLGMAIADAIRSWPEASRVAVIGSGGLSHFVVDEELDGLVLDALHAKDPGALAALPRNRLYSATSESLNWVTVGGAMQDSCLQMKLLAYVPVYRSEAGTGGGWAFAHWT
jgi:hypothetical protein